MFPYRLQAAKELLDLKDDIITDLLAGLAAHTKALQEDRKEFEAVLQHIEVERAVSAQVSRAEKYERE